MRGRSLLAGLGVAAGVSPLFAQFPPPAQLPPSSTPLPARTPAPYQPASTPIQPRSPVGNAPGSPTFPSSPATPATPGMLPPGVMRPAVPQPGASVPPAPALIDGTAQSGRVETPLPHPEDKAAIDAGTVTVKRVNGTWQVWAGQRPLKNLGADETGAKDVVRVIHDLHPTEWAVIGSPRPVVEYGLTNGKPAFTAGFPRMVVPIDLRTVRVEPVKGVWCLRDDGNILFNFGLHKADADQALAVVRRYGFNRIGMVGGDITAPAMRYFFVALEADGAKPPEVNPLLAAVQENGLLRTGIPVPGVGFIGEMVKIDPRKAEVRQEGADWVAASGAEVLARFGRDQGAARDAVRLIQDGNFTEFCRPGPPGLTFFLANGQAPSRVPLYVQGRRYDPGSLKVARYGERWAITERGRHLFDLNGPDEGEAVIRLLKYYRFDQLCQLGSSPRACLVFLAKGR